VVVHTLVRGAHERVSAQWCSAAHFCWVPPSSTAHTCDMLSVDRYLATIQHSCHVLCGVLQAVPSKPSPGVGTCCLYFSAPKAPLPGNILYLSGEDDSAGIVNNCCFPSEVRGGGLNPGQSCFEYAIGTCGHRLTVMCAYVHSCAHIQPTMLQAQFTKLGLTQQHTLPCFLAVWTANPIPLPTGLPYTLPSLDFPPVQVSPTYAPAGRTLVSASTVGTHDSLSDSELEAAVRKHLSDWFGASEVAGWKHIRTYRIPYAQPNQVCRCPA
jgi:hypothetical protein